MAQIQTVNSWKRAGDAKLRSAYAKSEWEQDSARIPLPKTATFGRLHATTNPIEIPECPITKRRE